MNVGARIREHRKAKGLSQVELGQKVGLSQKTITNYERGEREPSLDTLRDLAKALEVPFERLVVLDEGKKSEPPPKSPRVAKNKRSLKAQKLFEALSPTEQRVILKQIELMAKAAK
jgi:transcriptional regulator with XRE-family HTH domain